MRLVRESLIVNALPPFQQATQELAVLLPQPGSQPVIIYEQVTVMLQTPTSSCHLKYLEI